MPPHMTGQAIGQGMGQGLARLAEASLSLEILYAFVIITCSLMIYFATKELYILSNHKGLKYFRLSFLFFAIAYFFRSFIKFTLMSINQIPIEFKIGLEQLTFMLFIYFSTMAILYLLYSVAHKKLNKNFLTAFHTTAIAIAFLIIILREQSFYLILNLTLLIFTIITFYISKKKKKNSLHIIYTLMTLFWTMNVIDTLIPNFFRTTQLLIYLASLSIFLTMLYKVLKKTG